MSQATCFPRFTHAFHLVILLYLTAIPVRAQTLQIPSPADGSVAYSGQTLNVAITASGTFQYVAVLVQGPLSSPQPLTAPPYQFAIQVPSTIASGRYGMTPTGITASGQVVDMDPIAIDIERADAPQKLTTQISALYMDYIGDRGNLIVYGQFADGSTRRPDVLIPTRIFPRYPYGRYGRCERPGNCRRAGESQYRNHLLWDFHPGPRERPSGRGRSQHFLAVPLENAAICRTDGIVP